MGIFSVPAERTNRTLEYAHPKYSFLRCVPWQKSWGPGARGAGHGSARPDQRQSELTLCAVLLSRCYLHNGLWYQAWYEHSNQNEQVRIKCREADVRWIMWRLMGGTWEVLNEWAHVMIMWGSCEVYWNEARMSFERSQREACMSLDEPLVREPLRRTMWHNKLHTSSTHHLPPFLSKHPDQMTTFFSHPPILKCKRVIKTSVKISKTEWLSRIYYIENQLK